MRALLLSLPLIMGACSTYGDDSGPSSASPLTEGSWRLAEFQSSDDAIGTKRPAADENYELTFGADGTVAARLACNRGSGTWAVAGSSATGGQISFGRMAVTQAACVNATMDGQVTRDFQHIASYTLRDGALFLALKADGGIYKWVRSPQPR